MADKHTPGPWSCVPSIPEEGVECFWIENGAQRIAAVDGPQNEEREATAHLIAAAPELLEALEKRAQVDAAYSRLALMDRDPDEHERLLQAIEDAEDAAKDAARAALSKARGEHHG